MNTACFGCSAAVGFSAAAPFEHIQGTGAQRVLWTVLLPAFAVTQHDILRAKRPQNLCHGNTGKEEIVNFQVEPTKEIFWI